jgi:hypothetical protein
LNRGEDPFEGRWKRLLTLAGVCITLSEVTAELTGYTHFLRNANNAADICLKHFGSAFEYEVSQGGLIATKAGVVAIGTWILFFLALRSYSRAYHKIALSKWIEEDVCFLAVSPKETPAVVIKTQVFLFIAVPFAALLPALALVWDRNRFAHCAGLHIKLRLYLWEVVFHLVVTFVGGMIVYLLLKSIATLL